MNIAIVGSRHGFGAREVTDWIVANVKDDDLVITGGAPGVDTIAFGVCVSIGVRVLVIPPQVRGDRGRDAFAAAAHERNRKIAMACDRLMAFHFNNSPGTASTIRYARELGKPVEVREKASRIAP